MDEFTSLLMDRIRGLAAIVVAIVHTFQVFILPYVGLGTPLHIGTSLLATYAVLSFFIVSGFMIFFSIKRHSSDGTFIWKNYFRARILRIYPPLIAAIALTFLIYLIIVGFQLHGTSSFRLGDELFVIREKVQFSIQNLGATIFLSYGVVPTSPPPLNMNGPLWTLSYEFWIYFLVMFFVNSLSGKFVVGHIPLIILVAFIFIGKNWLFFAFFAVWMSGFALAWLYDTKKLFAKNAAFFFAAAMLLCFMVALFLSGPELVSNILEPYRSTTSQMVLALVGMVFVVILAIAIISRLSDKKDFLARSAKFSYTLYVVHFPLLILGFSLSHNWLHQYGWKMSLMVAIIVFCSIVFFASWLAKIIENRSKLLYSIDLAKRKFSTLFRNI